MQSILGVLFSLTFWFVFPFSLTLFQAKLISRVQVRKSKQVEVAAIHAG